MKADLIVVGKTTSGNIATCIDDYVDRIKRYLPFSIIIITDSKHTKSLSEQQQREQEGERILRLIEPNDYVVLLDERGKSFSSIDFADWLSKKQQSPHRLLFIIGGPYGFSQAVYKRANELLSLSQMTFSHQLVRLIFTEQLYRACTIIRGEPYHHK